MSLAVSISGDASQVRRGQDTVPRESNIQSLSPPSPSSSHATKDHAPQKVGGALQSNVTFGLGMSETGLVQRLQFEARVLTQ